MTRELWFHLVEIIILFFGVALPVTWAVIRLISLLKDFPPHVHINGNIMYPKGYEPPEIVRGRRVTDGD